MISTDLSCRYKVKGNMFLVLFVVNTLGRILAPWMIFSHPIFAAIGSYFFDMFDGYFAYRSKFSWRTYHRFDKLFDLYWYFFIVLYGWHTGNKEVFVLLFLYRFIGQFLSIAFLKERYLMFFPDILEHFFYLHLIFTLVPAWTFLLSGFWQILVIAFALVIALWRERFILSKHKTTGERLFLLAPKWKRTLK